MKVLEHVPLFARPNLGQTSIILSSTLPSEQTEKIRDHPPPQLGVRLKINIAFTWNYRKESSLSICLHLR